ncbi:hypothetical protein PSACC_00471 [Paramicrosporidium saccamoebae]|uniref:Uncharacterized protein n=1 Tax=Paramicrosporidium saccamoebae TaxID=1246581 RepID=A0A2H9TPQ0_9FUNG|nr:hypothetical protein PSACC_00471 [Paramicrosporidium saccamoebae]
MLLSYALFHVALGLEITLTMTKYYALGSNSRRGIMHNLDLTNADTLKALPGILSSTDPFPAKDDFYTRSLSHSDAAALFEGYFDNPQLHPLLFPVFFVVREPHLYKLLADRYEEYMPRYIEYDEDQFETIPTGLRDRLLRMLISRPSMLKSRIGMMPSPHNTDFYWNAQDAWNDLHQGTGSHQLAIISLLDPSSSSDADADRLTVENTARYIGNGQFAADIKLLFEKGIIFAHEHLHLVLSECFTKRPEILAFWHARLVYSILSSEFVNGRPTEMRKCARVLVKGLLTVHNVELIPPMYLGKIVQILAHNKIHCSTNTTGDYAKNLAYAQGLAPETNSIWGGCLQAVRQWGIFLHQNFGWIRWPASINTVEEAEEFWGNYKGDLRHAIPAFTNLPGLINFPSTACDTVECLVEESVKLYTSAGRWSTEGVFLDRASTRLWSTRFLHTCQAHPLSTLEVPKLFKSETALSKILATSDFFDYIPEQFAQASEQVLEFRNLGHVLFTFCVVILFIAACCG